MVPIIPESAPFTLEQRAWLNGYLAGLYSRAPVDSVAANAATAVAAKPTPTLTPLTILFGSQTGTAEGLAKRAAKQAGQRGFAATVLDMAQTDAAKLAQEKNVLLITSTYGDGEPPNNAKALHAALGAEPGPDLAQMRFSVCGLGDINYVHFCKCGQEFDTLLERRGARRVVARVDCDVEYEARFATWLDAALAAFDAGRRDAAGAGATGKAAAAPSGGAIAPEAATGYSRANPLAARVRSSRLLNAAGATKQVHHVVFELGDSGLQYEAGDALGVFPHNCPALVADVVTALGCDGEEAVAAPDGSTTSLRHALAELYDLGQPAPELLALLAPAAAGRGQDAMYGAAPHHVIDVLLARVDVKLPPAEFVRTLKKLQPRLYSISSSPNAHPGEVHLTVGAVRYELHGRQRKGVCSTFLADRIVPGGTPSRIFVHSNRAFRPPAAPDTPMIMVGPGTGIAPFRGFLHERRVTGARGRNWLFFGEQRAGTDFLYAEELADFQADGTLTRLDLAWSRDQPEKIYVQHRMLEQARELYAWLEAGAHFYVCGDASRMARDVDLALHTVIESAGGKTVAQAAQYVEALKATKRYARDVY